MKSLKGTRTEKNLLIAFAGESKEGFVQISYIFQEFELICENW